jgi:DNA-binding response OmpR family regulator
MVKILIIEDDMDTAKVLQKRLSAEGFDARAVYDAYSGISTIRKEDIDLIILDIMLPAGGGMSILRNKKLFTQGKHVPVLVLTGVTDREYREKVMDMGAEAYMEKPYDPAELVKTIKKILKT